MNGTNNTNIVFTINHLQDGKYHLFYFDKRHRYGIKGCHTGRMADAFQFLHPDAVCVNQQNYHWYVNRLVYKRRQLAIEEIEAYGTK